MGIYFQNTCISIKSNHYQPHKHLTKMSDSAPVWQAAPIGSVIYRPPMIEDLETIADLEVRIRSLYTNDRNHLTSTHFQYSQAVGYPADEAASFDRLKFRIENASNLFLVAVRLHESDPGYDILGYCCGTSTTAAALTEESMGEHEPDGRLLCIHSVCVAQPERRKGVATKLLKAYLNYIQQTSPHIEQVRLICKEPLVDLYKGASFQVVGPSPVVHGKDPWIEMMLDDSDGAVDGQEYSDWT